MRNVSVSCVASSILALSIGACTVAHSRRTAEHPSAPADDAGHWVHDERLRAVMTELEMHTRTSWPQEIQAERAERSAQERAQAMAEARTLSQGLAEGAGQIPAAVAHIKMAEVDRRSFLVQVDTLCEQAQRLGNAATAGDIRAMRAELDAISETCHSCHQRFRDFSGPLTRP